MIYLIWAIFGGFISHFLLSNYLSVLLKPSFEKPVDTASDLISRNITPFYAPNGKPLKKLQKGAQEVQMLLFLSVCLFDTSTLSSMALIKSSRGVLQVPKMLIRSQSTRGSCLLKASRRKGSHNSAAC